MALLLLALGALGAGVGFALPAVIERIGGRRPATDAARPGLFAALTAGAFVLVGWRAVQLGREAAIPALLTFTALGIALAAIDLSVHRLPDALVLPAYPVLGLLLAGAAIAAHDGWSVARAVLAAAALFAFFAGLAAVHPRGMGFGDVKFAGVVGLVLGSLSWTALLAGAFAAFALGGVVAVVVLVTRRGSRTTALPFGPFLVAGALVALWVAEPVTTLAR